MDEQTRAEALYEALTAALEEFVEANPETDVLEVAQALAAVTDSFLNGDLDDDDEAEAEAEAEAA